MNFNELAEWAETVGWTIRSCQPRCVTATRRDGARTITWVKVTSGYWVVARTTGRRKSDAASV